MDTVSRLFRVGHLHRYTLSSGMRERIIRCSSFTLPTRSFSVQEDQYKKLMAQYPRNHRVTAESVRVLDQFKKMIGIMPTKEALERARTEGLDLVCVQSKSKPPVCQIIQYNIFLESVKRKIALVKDEENMDKKMKKMKRKVVRLTDRSGESDVTRKLDQMRGFLDKGFLARLELKKTTSSIKIQETPILDFILDYVKEFAMHHGVSDRPQSTIVNFVKLSDKAKQKVAQRKSAEAAAKVKATLAQAEQT
eukprot:137401_1